MEHRDEAKAVRQHLEQIYRDHRQGLFALALTITRSVHIAEDSVHDAFARLWRSQAQPEGDPVAYVFASVRNAAVQQLRRRRHEVEVPASLFDSCQADPVDVASGREQQARIQAQIDGLPARQRQTVVLKLYAGLTFQQIADALDEPLPTVASRYRRALLHIKEQLELPPS